jgi:glycine/D-amino acid oxidase-like deaminating enzyme/nitrite reductase/ring-hydroxylating ferredoxin subunit
MSSRNLGSNGNATTSIWQATAELPTYDEPVSLDAKTGVCVVGAGISGLSVAYALACDGVAVTVLDDGPVGGGETSRTTAHLSNALDDRYHELERLFGEAGARLAAQSHRAAIESIESIAMQHAIACDFRRVDGYLFAPPAQQAELERELAAAQRAGLDVAMVDRAPLPFDTGRCVRFANQAEFHPVAYLRGLAAAVVAAGGRIHTGVRVDAIEGGAAPRVELAGGGVLRADAVVDASNASITSRFDLPIRQAAYRTYVVGLDVPRGAIPHALYWDTEEPYHYVRIAPGEDGRELVLVGGADHRTGQAEETGRFDELEAWARERMPRLGAATYRWSGQIMEPADALGYIGPVRGMANVFLVSGDSGNGLTNGALAGLLLPALIRGESHLWAELYSPARGRHHGLGTLVREAVSSTVQYVDWVRPSDVGSLAEIPNGEGRVLRHGVHRIAAYRTESGACHLRSARCAHLHAVVRWNALEQSWDCPAHGSRYDARGCVINSPAAHDLAPLAPDVEASVRATELGAPRPAVQRSPRVPQGAYYLATGLWPVLHLRSFEAVSGTHGDRRLVKTLGGLIAAVGAALLAGRGTASARTTRVLGVASAVALGAGGVYVATRDRRHAAHLIDSAIEAGFALVWLLTGRRRP